MALKTKRLILDMPEQDSTTQPTDADGKPTSGGGGHPDSGQLDQGTYDIIRNRLRDQGKTLRTQLDKLNDERKDVFGSIEFELTGTDRLTTDHNCVPRDMAAVGDRILVGYNVQTAVDTETHLIVAHEVTNVVHDRAQLAPMAKAAKAALNVDELGVIADRGYFSSTELLACDEAGITPTVPRPETSGNRKKGMFVKADFFYDAATDTYTCPAGKALTYRYTREEKGLMHRRYWQNDCQSCHLKPRCTTGKERRITRWEHEHLIEAIYARMEENPDLMRLRRCTVEHPFGTIKAWMGATHFQMRRLKNVSTEMALQVLAYNIKRVLNMIGAGPLLKAITA